MKTNSKVPKLWPHGNAERCETGLTDLVEKMSLLRQDKAELNKAVQLLLSKMGRA
jgi:hypothetical protein